MIYKMGLEGQKETILVASPVCDTIPADPESENQRGLCVFKNPESVLLGSISSLYRKHRAACLRLFS